MKPLLVLMPEPGFAELAALLGQGGWRAVSQAADPLQPGEPEHASFECAGGERIVYTYNPVCRLRVLDTTAAGSAALPPALSVALAKEVRGWLGSTDERTLLRGILAVAQLGETALAPLVEAQRGHPHPTIAQAAARALQGLTAHKAAYDPASAARGGALVAIELLKQQLTPLLYALAQDRDGRVAASLRPQAADFLLAFVPDAAVAASEAYEAAALTARVAPVSAMGNEVQLALAPAGMLGDDNALSRQFPSGYRAIAHLLAPERIWARWKYVRRGEAAGISYDGLVWLDDRWVWFPKPYRVLSA